MEISRFVPAGKLPTITHDAGAWYSWALPQTDRFFLSSFSANYSFWNALCSPKLKEALLFPFSQEQRMQALRSWGAQGIDLDVLAEKASLALRGFSPPSSFSMPERYSRHVADLSVYLSALNRIQKSVNFSVQMAPYVRDVDYSSSASLSSYALRSDTFFYRLTAGTLSDFSIGERGVVLITIKSQLEILTAMSAAVVIRERFPGVHLCLAEHRYEYFSLDPHMEKLKKTGALLKIFDSVVESSHTSQGLIAALLESLSNNERISGFINTDTYKKQPDTFKSRRVPPSDSFAFTPEPILWTRLSPSGCYWGKCAFCSHIHEEEPCAPIKAFAPDALVAYLSECVSSGYIKFIFSDEAVSPENIEKFCLSVLREKLDINWSCRCRCDITLGPELLHLMVRAGCREILFGMETASERLQVLMHKYENPVSPSSAKKLFCAVNDAGLGIHLSLMGGFPGETPVELRATVDYVKDVLKDMKGATYDFNQFELLPGSKMFANPADYKVEIEAAEGDLPLRYRYLLSSRQTPETEDAASLIDSLRDELGTALGWGRLSGKGVSEVIRYLYFSSGHGLIFKSSSDNPFENPLKKALPGMRA